MKFNLIFPDEVDMGKGIYAGIYDIVDQSGSYYFVQIRPNIKDAFHKNQGAIHEI